MDTDVDRIVEYCSVCEKEYCSSCRSKEIKETLPGRRRSKEVKKNCPGCLEILALRVPHLEKEIENLRQEIERLKGSIQE